MFLTLCLLANPSFAQMAVHGAHTSKSAAQASVMHTARTSNAAPAVNITGFWHGAETDTNDDPGGNTWNLEFDLHQDGQGNVSGTRRMVSAENPAWYILWSVTGVVSGDTFNFNDVAILGQNTPPGTPCVVTATTTISADGKSFSGPWTSPDCDGLLITGASYGSDQAKNMGDGARCDGGEGTAGGGSHSGDGAESSHFSLSCPEKSGVPDNGQPSAGDPINTSTGNKYLQEDDYTANAWLTFRRFYNSSNAVAPGYIGAQWRHSFDRSLAFFGSPINTIVMYRPDGKEETFTKSGSTWSTELPIDILSEVDNAQGVATGYTVFIGATRHTETYDAAGKLLAVNDQTGQGITLTYSTATTPPEIAQSAGLLLTVTDPQGRQLNFTYSTNQNLAKDISKLTLPDGTWYDYLYDDLTGNLVAIRYFDGTYRQYVYNESSLTGGATLLTSMTGIIDESFARYENTTYDSLGRATSSAFAGNVGTTQITYNADGSSSVTYPLGHVVNFGYATADGLVRVGTVDQPCNPDCNQPWKTRSYDNNGYPAVSTDFNNTTTSTTYENNGLLLREFDAIGTANQRDTEFEWNDNLRVPVARSIYDGSGSPALSTTQWAYNTGGQVVARCEFDTTNSANSSYTCAASGTVPDGVRRWTYTYCTVVDAVQCPVAGLLLSSTGPRTDVLQTTTYSYYLSDSSTSRHGDLMSVTDPVGHVTRYLTYDGAGRVLSMQEANGANVAFTYTPRGFLATRSLEGATTQIAYTPFGAIQSITDADGIAVTFGYDGAHRLTTITDPQGNYVQYTLDAAGNRVAENTYSSGGATVSRSVSRHFNSLGELTTVIDGLNHTQVDASAAGDYDNNGNLVQSADAFGTQRRLSYDALNRLTSTVDDYHGSDPGTANATLGKTSDILNRLTQITDPSGLATTYGYDGLGNANTLDSPDTGHTSRTFDLAGNIVTSTDNRGTQTNYSYDAINRRTALTYSNEPDENVAYNYDEPNSVTGCTSSYSVGRLTRIIETLVTTVYCYDARGNITKKQQITSAGVDTTSFTYTSGNRLSGVTYASGTRAAFAFDTNGRIRSITVTPSAGSATIVVSNVSYAPFGPILSYTLGNGQVVTRTYDTNYALTDLTSPAVNLHFARDAIGNIRAEGAAPGVSVATESYSYDALYRLTGVSDSSTPIEGITYNATGDRLSKTGGGYSTGGYGYNIGHHELITVGATALSYEARGNLTGSYVSGQSWGYAHDEQNRLRLVQSNYVTVATYDYNALGQRIDKTAGNITSRYNYSEQNTILTEFNTAASGTSWRDYVWLGNLPIALVDGTSGSAAPAAISYITADQLGTPRAVSDASGNTVWQWAYVGNPFGELAPTSNNGFTLNLRYPGQYYDAETQLNYNFRRYYSPATGRYIESDPVGLSGGPSTYAYVQNNPLGYNDPTGQFIPEAIIGGVIGTGFGLITGYISGDRGSQLFEDAIAGGSSGLLIGLTDGLSLAASPAIALAGKAGIGAVIGSGLEATRQLSNYGCISSYTDIGVAGGLGALSAGTGVSAFEAAGAEPLEGAASYITAALSGTTAGAVQTQVAANEAAEAAH